MSGRRRFGIVLRLPGGRGTLSAFVAGSIAAHVVLTLILVLAPLGRHRAVAANDSMVVELAGPMPGPASSGSVGGPPATKPAPPTPPAPKPEPKGPTVVEPPKEKTQEKKKDDREKEKKAQSLEPPATKPAPPAQPAQPAPGPSGPPGVPPGGGGGGVVGGSGGGALDPGSSELAWYWASVTAALRSHWARPVLEGGSGVLNVTITFDVRRDGTVANATVETGSGVPSLDRSALRAVADASPLPPLPASSKEASVSARYQFELTPGEGG